MTIRSDLSIDWEVSPRIITVASPSTEIIMQDLHDTLRSLESQTGAMDDPSIVTSAGKEPLGGGVTVGLTITLLDAKLAFEGRAGPDYIQCNAQGGNLVAFDSLDQELDPIQPTAFTQVVRTSSSSATLQELEAIQYASYDGGIWVDTSNGTTSTEYPAGTPSNPVLNLAYADILCNTLGFDKIYLLSDITYLTTKFTVALVEKEIIGRGMTRTVFDAHSYSYFNNCTFKNLLIYGQLDGGSAIEHCAINNLDYVDGTIHDSMLVGNITLASTETYMNNCYSGVAGGAATPVIHFAGAGGDAVIRNYSGGLELQGKSDAITPGAVSIDMASGQLIIDSTCTAGELTVRGVGKLIDNSNGTTVHNEMLNPVTIADTVWDTDTSTHTDTTKFGGYINKLVLTVQKFLALK